MEWEKKISILEQEKLLLNDRQNKIDSKIYFLKNNHPDKVEKDKKLKEIDDQIQKIKNDTLSEEMYIKDLKSKIEEHNLCIKERYACIEKYEEDIDQIRKNKCKYQDHIWKYCDMDLTYGNGVYYCVNCQLEYDVNSKEASELNLKLKDFL